MADDWTKKAELARAGIRRTTAGFQKRRGDGGRKEPKYPPLPGFGWDFPWPDIDWARIVQRPPWGWPTPPAPEPGGYATPYQPPAPERGRAPEVAVPEEELYGRDLPPGWREEAYVSPRWAQFREDVTRWAQNPVGPPPSPPPIGWADEGLKGWYEETIGGQYYRPSGRYVREVAESAADMPPIDLPPDWETMTWQEQESWANENAYASAFVDEEGNIIDYKEALRLAKVSPLFPIKQIFFTGGGSDIASDPFAARELLEMGLGPKVDIPEMRLPKQQILDSDLSYKEKQLALTDLYGETTGQAMDEQTRHRLKQEVWESLSPKEQDEAVDKGKKSERIGELKHELSILLGIEDEDELMRLIRLGEEFGTSDVQEIARLAQMLPERWRLEPVDIEGLRGELTPYGVNLIENYPFISPITEALLRRIPSETLEKMAKYLDSKGISWQDFLEVSRGLYAGGVAQRPEWGVAQQWG